MCLLELPSAQKAPTALNDPLSCSCVACICLRDFPCMAPSVSAGSGAMLQSRITSNPGVKALKLDRQVDDGKPPACRFILPGDRSLVSLG
jgi:hypothetical protein